MQSCLYEGTVAHCRHQPLNHQFKYRLYMAYLDLEELPELVGQGSRALISDRRWSAASFLRRDHLYDSGTSLAEEVRNLVAEQTGIVARGPIRLLTQLRCFGYFMSPLNLFYLFDPRGEQVETIVAEVNNTPWNERHCYVLWDGNRNSSLSQSDALHFEHAKEFHVSPFMDMEMQYCWRLSQPGEDLQVQLANWQRGGELFSASMQLQRREISRANLRRMLLRYPAMTAKIVAAIYYQALLLWWKKCPSFTHPKNLANKTTSPAPLQPDTKQRNQSAA